ncbi:MAG: putative amino acid permease [Burkholderiales bacterium]|jgi:amino acid transporter|nr:putative amino acid permease [Burkholderiales bacterium]
MSNPPKKISLFSAIALSATSMIGSGWLFSAQLNAKLSGDYAFLAWIAAAIIVLLVGLCLSQVVARYPVRGATTRSSALSHNNIFGMPFAFANWFGVLVAVPNEAQATTQYLAAAMESATLIDHNTHALTFAGKMFALGILGIYLLINYYGIKLLAKVNNTVTVFKIFTPIFTVIVFLIAKFDTSNFSLASNASYSVSSIFSAIVGGGLIYSYNGFQLPASFASEINNPKRNVAIAMISSIIIVMILYMLLQLAFMGGVPHDMIATGGWASLNFHSPLLNLSFLLGLNFVSMLLIADSIVSPSGTGYSYLGGSARMFYAMAAAGQMPKWTISKLHPKYNLCRRSMLLNFIIAAVILWGSESWATLMLVVSGYNIIGYMAAPVSMGAIKSKTRLFGAFVFVLIGLIMSTIPARDLCLISSSITILVLIYSAIGVKNGQLSIKDLLILNLPIIGYLWSLYFSQNHIYTIVMALIFYFLVTHPKYVAFCQSSKVAEIDQETNIVL